MPKLKEMYQALVDGQAIIGTDEENEKIAIQLDEEGHLHYLQYYLEEVHDNGDYIEPEGWYDISCYEDPYPLIIKAINESRTVSFHENEVTISESLRTLDIADTSLGCLMTFKKLLESLLKDEIVIVLQKNNESLTFELGEDDHIKILCFHYDEDVDDSVELDYHAIEWHIDISHQFATKLIGVSTEVRTVSKTVAPTEETLYQYIKDTVSYVSEQKLNSF